MNKRKYNPGSTTRTSLLANWPGKNIGVPELIREVVWWTENNLVSVFARNPLPIIDGVEQISSVIYKDDFSTLRRIVLEEFECSGTCQRHERGARKINPSNVFARAVELIKLEIEAGNTDGIEKLKEAYYAR